MSKYNTEIANYIFDNYVFNQELLNHDENIKQLELLVDNKRAIKIEVPYVDEYYSPVSEYNIICKFLIKHDKTLKKYVTPDNDPLQNTKIHNRRLVLDDYMTGLKKYRLELGTYYVQLGNKSEDEYAVLTTSKDKEDRYCFSFTLYLIGEKYDKYRDKIFEKISEFKEKKKELNKNMHNRICYDFSKMDDIKFKPFDFMVFDEKEQVIDMINKWKENLPEYSKYKIVPKLSILLHGLPGTGKSTFYKALADLLDIDTVISLSPGYFIDTFSGGDNQRRYVDGVICIDDIDCICKSREDEKDNRENSAIMHNLLSFLDNPPTTFIKHNDQFYEVAIVVATTNYFDRLDDAVKRYGRFDMKIHMDYFNKEKASEFCQIYGLKLEDVVKKNITDKFKIAPAELEALCISNIDKNMKG